MEAVPIHWHAQQIVPVCCLTTELSWQRSISDNNTAVMLLADRGSDGSTSVWEPIVERQAARCDPSTETSWSHSCNRYSNPYPYNFVDRGQTGCWVFKYGVNFTRPLDVLSNKLSAWGNGV